MWLCPFPLSSYGQLGISNEVYNVPIFTRSLWAMNHRTWNYLSQLCKLDTKLINCKLRNLVNSVSWLESSHLSLMELKLATRSTKKRCRMKHCICISFESSNLPWIKARRSDGMVPFESCHILLNEFFQMWCCACIVLWLCPRFFWIHVMYN